MVRKRAESSGGPIKTTERIEPFFLKCLKSFFLKCRRTLSMSEVGDLCVDRDVKKNGSRSRLAAWPHLPRVSCRGIVLWAGLSWPSPPCRSAWPASILQLTVVPHSLAEWRDSHSSARSQLEITAAKIKHAVSFSPAGGAGCGQCRALVGSTELRGPLQLGLRPHPALWPFEGRSTLLFLVLGFSHRA